MVEGPGCKIKGENIRAKLKNKRISNIIVKQTSQNANGSCSGNKKQEQCNKIVGQTLEEVITLGKELFMIFGDQCLRIHFLMNGSHRISPSTVVPNDKKEEPVVLLYFQQTVLYFYQSAFDVRSTQSCLERYEELKDVDICSQYFNAKKALPLIMVQKGRQLCDILLDQTILPGVGNIIKNEALFDSGINPCMMVDELKPEHISNIIKMTRDFTMIFYQCRKTGKPLNKYYRIYAQETCKSCGTKVTKTRMGDDSGRVTYFCSSCQTADISKLDKLTLPSKNSLLSWVKTANCKTAVDWSCPVCTLVNKATHLSCDACLGPKPNQSDIPDQSNSSLVRKETAIDQSNSSLVIDLTLKSTQEPQSLSLDTAKKVITVSSTNILSPKNSFQGSKKRKSSDSQDSKQLQFNSKKIKKENGETENNVKIDLNSKFPNCSQHGKKCALWQTHKPGPNKNRWFFTCCIKGPKKCNYFEWSDKRFPVCSGHDKTCGYHTVLKLGANNGRKFFTCSLPKKEQCEFFEWADGFGDDIIRK